MKKYVSPGDIVKFKSLYLKVTAARLYDDNFKPVVELERKDGKVIYPDAHLIKHNGKFFYLDQD